MSGYGGILAGDLSTVTVPAGTKIRFYGPHNESILILLEIKSSCLLAGRLHNAPQKLPGPAISSLTTCCIRQQG
ncbi:hypothetical protein [Arthrobacter psychrochitiniphilus]|uniref:hypothetical protein n=1 Tax=Arthrobacter psychrochitiniphilus TaxID=291045 RepID=UPI003F7C9C69